MEKESNWLPAPSAPFYTILRIYGPDPSLLKSDYKWPEVIGVEKIKTR